MLTKELKSKLKKRIILGNIDFFIFLFFWGTVHAIFIEFINAPKNLSLFYFYILIPFFVSFIIYYGAIPKATKGYTLMGYLFKFRIIQLDNINISIYQYSFRALYAILSPFKFLFYTRIKVNKKGQLYYDIFLNTTVVDNTKTPEQLIEKDGKYYSYYFLGENIQYIFYFMGVIFAIVTLQNIVEFIIKLF